MEFRYRYVPYGTNFTSAAGDRADGADRAAPAELRDNELAFDVGGTCWTTPTGVDGTGPREPRRVIDHHYPRAAGQFPAAAAATLHLAAAIKAWGDTLAARPGGPPVVWLVTHMQPDFDAFCSVYLAKLILAGRVPADGWDQLGLHPDGWLPVSVGGRDRRIGWFTPKQADGLDDTRRAAVLLAAYAARLDNCRRLGCAPDTALHSVLYAAIVRGRGYDLRPTRSADPVFDAAWAAMTGHDRLNPLVEPLFRPTDPAFAPELALLARERERYARDVRRAGRVALLVPKAAKPFDEWFDPLLGTPVVVGPGPDPAPAHARGGWDATEQVDGIFIRDPECTLFKEWARTDAENAPGGQGFTFTAVAYGENDAIPATAPNTTRYYLSLDPEVAYPRGLHLYPLWAALQAAEVAALRGPAGAGLVFKDVREKFEGRAGAVREGFDDPWFDGNNYRGTIIDTPNRGTYLGAPGRAADLSDDPVGRLAHRLLVGGTLGPAVGQLWAVGPYRLILKDLDPAVRPFAGAAGAQVGRQLWEELTATPGAEPPPDFVARHLCLGDDWVGVWHPVGVAVAVKPDARPPAAEYRDVFRELMAVNGAVRKLADTPPTDATLPALIRDGDDLTRRLARLEHRLAEPAFDPFDRFIAASRIDRSLAALRDLNAALDARGRATWEKQLAGRVSANLSQVAAVQRKVEWIEVFLISVYAAHLFHMICHGAFDDPHHLVSWGTGLVAVAAFVAAFLLVRPDQIETHDPE